MSVEGNKIQLIFNISEGIDAGFCADIFAGTANNIIFRVLPRVNQRIVSFNANNW